MTHRDNRKGITIRVRIIAQHITAMRNAIATSDGGAVSASVIANGNGSVSLKCKSDSGRVGNRDRQGIYRYWLWLLCIFNNIIDVNNDCMRCTVQTTLRRNDVEAVALSNLVVG